jgi:hypothetical protein
MRRWVVRPDRDVAAQEEAPVTLRTVPAMNTHETRTHVHDDDAGETTR